ncbi:MAG: hypothetical protein QM804_06790 [Propionicimonas sp.]
MTSEPILPAWLGQLAALDDDAIAELANRGLLRRATKLVDAVTMVATDDKTVELECEQLRVRLLPDGPTAARCPCPVAGVCVHVVAAWLWTRTAAGSIEPATPPPEPGSPVDFAPPEAGEGMWTMPTGAAPGAPDPTPPNPGIPAAQRQAAGDVAEVIERLVATGLAQLGTAAIDRLARAGQRARLERLLLLARLVDTAAGRLRALARRDDTADESDALSALAQAWALATRLLDDSTPVPDGLVGAPSKAEAEVGTLLPLAARWWTSASGARGLTFHAFDLDHHRLEEATNGRAAGTDPTFQSSWEAPLLWGASPARLSSGLVRLTGAERRDDGTLSPTTRTRVEVTPWRELDLEALADAVNSQSGGIARTTFGHAAEPVRLIRPRHQVGLGAIELDEVTQQLVWPVVDADGGGHRLALPASEHHVRLLTWLIEQSRLLAVVAVGDRPEAAFLREKEGARLVSLSLTPLDLRSIGPSWRRRILKLDQHRRAEVPLREPTELERLCAACADVVEALAATGRSDVTPRQRETLNRRIAQADDLGLSTLAGALRPLTGGRVAPARLLWARFVLDRIGTLLD